METSIVRGYECENCVPMNDVREGDILIEHGGLWRLTEQIDTHKSYVWAWKSVFLGNVSDEYPCNVPTQWRNGWTFQGNRHRTVTRVLRVVGQ